MARRVLHVVLAGVVVVSFVVLAGLGLGPRTGRYRTLTVLSGSMRPTIPPGAVVLDTPVPLPDLRVGDIITYQAPIDNHPVVTHRIVQILDRGAHPVVRTKGDANASPDPWVARLDRGPAWRVRASVPGLGYMLQILRRPQVGRLLIWGAPLLLAGVWLVDIWTPARSDDGDAVEADSKSSV